MRDHDRLLLVQLKRHWRPDMPEGSLRVAARRKPESQGIVWRTSGSGKSMTMARRHRTRHRYHQRTTRRRRPTRQQAPPDYGACCQPRSVAMIARTQPRRNARGGSAHRRGGPRSMRHFSLRYPFSPLQAGVVRGASAAIRSQEATDARLPADTAPLALHRGARETITGGSPLGLFWDFRGMTVKQPKGHQRRSAPRSHPSRQVTGLAGLFRDI